MPPEPPPHAIDLLVVGALTIDRFADGSTAPGGSVLHAARAARASGYTVGVVTVVGSEPEARAALHELGELGGVHAERADRTLRFGHRETMSGRELILEASAPQLACPAREFDPGAVLYAPVAAEFGAGLGGQSYAGAVRGAILQGWLRSLEVGRRVNPLSFTALGRDLVEVLGRCAVLVASREDLLAMGPEPGVQLDALRERFGHAPVLVVTDGPAGAWLDTTSGRVLVAPSRVSQDPGAVGAGDAFAAILTAELGRGTTPMLAAERAASAVATILRDRSR